MKPTENPDPYATLARVAAALSRKFPEWPRERILATAKRTVDGTRKKPEKK